MSKKNFSPQLNSFKKRDILVYISIAIAIFFLFITLVIIPSTKVSRGFEMYYDGKKIFSLNYSNYRNYIIYDGFDDFISVSVDDCTVTFTFPEKVNEYNVIKFNVDKGFFEVVDSNCSSSKDCTYSPKVSSAGAIICSPHKLKISAIGSNSPTTPVTG